MTAAAATTALETRVRRWATGGAGAGAVLMAAGALTAPMHFLRSYLIAWIAWLGVSMGCLGFLMIHRLTGGGWGEAARPFQRSAALAVVPLAVLFLPIALGVERLYPWTDAAGDAVLERKAPYLDTAFFLGRSALYLGAWCVLAVAFCRDAGPGRRGLAGGGLALYVLTMSFASVDWMMSLEPHWHSTMYGLIVIAGQAVSALAMTVLALRLSPAARRGRDPDTQSVHDLGNFLMAFVLVWAYLSFSQFLIVWYADIPEEATWVATRTHHGWAAVALALVVGHFVVPFVVLLGRRTKRHLRSLAAVAGFVAVMRLVDVYWLITPAIERHGPGLHWLDAAAPLTIGCVWTAFVAWRLERAAPASPPIDSSREATHV